nr:WYL domain-containing transcriptional regulator [uncultured Carboxylicivirga sp.]
MSDHKKLQTLLELLMYLSSGVKYSLLQIQKRFDLEERTARRYLKTLREVGFIIPRPKNGLYHIDKTSPYFREISELLHFSREEAHILYNAIHSISNENTLKQNLIYKLVSLYDSPAIAQSIVKQQHSNNIHQLTRAIQLNRQVILEGYHSANSQTNSDRLIEPFEFTTNYISVWGYDKDSKSNKIFKTSRITSVKVLPEQWQNQALHKSNFIDVFRISSNQQITVKLILSLRAAELLKEEYPLAESFITPYNNGKYLFQTQVCGFEGVSRFVMGLCHEIEILAPSELKHFISNRIKKFLNGQ